MCGIIGYTGKREAIPIIIEGLSRLEYRGYDSAGIAYFSGGTIEVKRSKGKIRDLSSVLSEEPASSRCAIGHTRWATHGKPSVENAHPHRSGSIVLVHNGIIENYTALKRELEKDGFAFASETDTEVICHLINKYSAGVPLEKAVMTASERLRGAYALAVMSEREPGKIVGLRKDSPLVAGLAEGEYFVASDIPAFLNYSRKVVFLKDNELIVMEPGGVAFYESGGVQVKKKPVHITWSAPMAEKGGYKHFMLKEIHEQPRALADSISGRFNAETGEINLKEFHLSKKLLKSIRNVVIAACGTSWHAALAGKYMIEELTGIAVHVDIASEFRYRNPIIPKGCIFIAITQSGETADTLAAQRLARKSGCRVISICNVIGSTSSREADAVFYTRSGPEIGVASTKSFMTQLAGLYMFALALGSAQNRIGKKEKKERLSLLLTLPEKIKASLEREPEIESLARFFVKKNSFLYLGRGISYPIALEGALKLKEISYIHAEAYPAGEMKHGPIALVEEDYPVFFVAPQDRLYEKVLSNMEEIRSRGGRVIAAVTEEDTEAEAIADHIIRVPAAGDFLTQALMTVPLQLFAYYIGVLRGFDVDQPRNLAKSVTVE